MPRQRSLERQRIGFLSSWFCNSAIGRLCAGLIALLDRSKFEVRVFVVRDGKGSVRRDLFTDEIADSADRAEVLPHPLWEAQQVLSAAGLDALIFTDVGMEPFSRTFPGPFSIEESRGSDASRRYALAFGRVARVQAVFWGHPTTSGVGGHAVDYYLLMDGAEPGDVERPSGRYSEQLVRLDTMGAYYRRNESGQLRASASRGAYAANSTTLRAVDGRRRLYACPQHCLKFHPDFDAALLGILDADPDALIVLKDCANLAAGPGVVERLVAKGAAPKSLLVVGRVSLEEYVKIFGGSHVALEPFLFGFG